VTLPAVTVPFLGHVPMTYVARALAGLALVPLLLAMRDRAERSGRRTSVAEWVVLGVALIGFGGLNAYLLRTVVIHPPEWDFYAFWVRMRVASQGLDFYDPRHYAGMQALYGFSDAFRREVLEPGFNYPPQTMLFLEPFGFLEPRVAVVAWALFLIAGFVASTVLLHRLFLRERGAAGLALAAALVLMIPATASTLRVLQTNGITLMLLLLFWRDRERPRAGIWLALLPVVKPYLGVLWLWPLMRRDFRTLFAIAITSVSVAALAAIYFGPNVFARFFGADVVHSHPGWIYSQTVNQSLHATVIRALGVPDALNSPLDVPLTLVLTGVLLVVAGVCAWRARGAQLPWALAHVLVMTLMVYPGSLQHYHLLLLVPMLLAWSERARMPGGSAGTIALIALTWALCSTPTGATVFVAYALWWVVTLVRGLRPAAAPVPAAA
jgi:Glycosyltransferase family 87